MIYFVERWGRIFQSLLGGGMKNSKSCKVFFVTVHYAKPKARLGLGLTGVGRWEGTKNNDGN